ncbi:MAG: hydrolase [Rhodovibrionaceae bacterium]
MTLRATESLLLLIDIQERLAPAIEGGGQVVQRIELLLRAAKRLGIPALASEQYRKGLGLTLAVLCEDLPPERRIEKTAFSALREAPLAKAIAGEAKPQIVVAGMECHVCVLQTVLDLLAQDYEVYLVRDAVGSRRQRDLDAGIARMERAGAIPVTAEMVVFEWLERAGTPEFKDLLDLIK